MTSRRSFFTRLAQFAAVVAIAPQIAFGKKIDAVGEVVFGGERLDLMALFNSVYELARKRGALPFHNDVTFTVWINSNT